MHSEGCVTTSKSHSQLELGCSITYSTHIICAAVQTRVLLSWSYSSLLSSLLQRQPQLWPVFQGQVASDPALNAYGSSIGCCLLLSAQSLLKLFTGESNRMWNTGSVCVDIGEAECVSVTVVVSLYKDLGPSYGPHLLSNLHTCYRLLYMIHNSLQVCQCTYIRT